MAVSSQKSFATHFQARNFAASSAHMAAAHNLIPGGAHTYAREDEGKSLRAEPVQTGESPGVGGARMGRS